MISDEDEGYDDQQVAENNRTEARLHLEVVHRGEQRDREEEQGNMAGTSVSA